MGNACIIYQDAGGAEDIKNDALQKELARAIKDSLNLNLYTIMHEAMVRPRIEMSEAEIDSFIKRKVKNNLKLEISDNGDVEIEYRGRKPGSLPAEDMQRFL